MRIITFIPATIIAVLWSCAVHPQGGDQPKNIGMLNGHIFNGTGFTREDIYIINGRISRNKPGRIDSVIDASAKFIIPPFAEAHNHNLENDYKIEDAIGRYLHNGVFYVKMLSSIRKRIDLIKDKFNKPGHVDVSYAHAPLTATGGHPVKLRESFFDRGMFKGVFQSKSEIEGHGYFIVDTKEDLDQKWPAILSKSPDFIKIMLLWSEEYQKRKDDTAYFGQKGLNPLLVPQIVQKAHVRGLRVSAHVESAYDFHIAVTAGVDEIAHMPCIEKAERLAPADIALAKKKGIVVVTTISLVEKYKSRPDYDSLVANLKAMLLALKNAGVKIAIGSDIFTDNSHKEAALLYQWGLFTNLELLKMWCENSAQTIFPQRKIGLLRDGYEASLLVLNSNPLEHFEAVKDIYLLMKQGILIVRK